MSLKLVLALAFGGSLLTYFSGKISARIRNGCAVLVTLSIVVMIAGLHGNSGEESIGFSFLGFPLLLRINALSWLFAIAVSFLSSLSVIYSLSYMKNRERTHFYYMMLLLISASMLGIVFSADLLCFFIFWEIMSWSTFLLISYARGPALAAGMKYIIMSILGSLAMLMATLSIHTVHGTLVLAELAEHMSTAAPGHILFVMILFSLAFGIKNAVVPFHPWLPPAHSEAPSPFSAILSGILIKMGTFGFILLLYVIVGLKTFSQLSLFRYTLNIVAAITILIPTLIALLQNDAKRLLAWSTVAQAGYIILGIAFGTRLSVAGGLFHFVNHAIFKALLFLGIGAVEYRTNGVRDLDSLGGFIKRMPITFYTVLIGTCGLIGVPLTNGFVSKWILYKTLILDGAPFLAFAALFGTWGTILYGYKLVHNIFLGQLPEKYKDVKRAPFTMQFAMIILSLVVVLFGILPGIPLKLINTIGVSFGFESLTINLWGIVSKTNVLNTINLLTAILVACLVAWLIFRASPKATPISQEDTYAAGAAIPRDKYHYTVDFYNPLYRMITPFLKDYIDAFYIKLVGWTQGLCNSVRKIYTGYVGNYILYIVLFLALLIFIQLKWSLW